MINVLRWSLLLIFFCNTDGITSDYLGDEGYRKFLAEKFSTHFIKDEDDTEIKCRDPLRGEPLTYVLSRSDSQEIRLSILSSLVHLNTLDEIEVANFVHLCLEEYAQQIGLSAEDAFHSFSSDITYLEKYLKYLSPQKANDVKSRFFIQASATCLAEFDMTKGEQNLLSALKVSTIGQRSIVSSVLMQSLQELINSENLLIEKKVVAKKFSELYRNSLKKEESQLDHLDCIYLMVINVICTLDEDVLKFGELALAKWPSQAKPLTLFDKKLDETYVRTQILSAAFSTKNYLSFQRSFSTCTQLPTKLQILKIVMDVEQENWIEAQKSLEACYDHCNKYNDKTLRFQKDDGREALALLRLFNTVRTRLTPELRMFIKNILKASTKFENVKKAIDSLYNEFTEERYTRTQKQIRQAIVVERQISTKDFLRKYDLAYQSVWGLVTRNECDNGYILNVLDRLGTRFEDHYQQLSDLLEREDAHKDLVTVMAAEDQLQKAWEDFLWEANQVKLKIRELKRPKSAGGAAQAAVIPAGGYHYTRENLKGLYPRQVKGKEVVEPKSSSGFTGSGAFSTRERQVKGRMISFKNAKTATIWKTKDAGQYPRSVLEIMQALDQASNMRMLRLTLGAGSSLELLKGDREGQISLRINDQWRLCFTWETGVGAHNIEIVDYH